jgi:hypothetical protein
VIHVMNGSEVGRALVNRFETVGHAEIVRLRRKLGIWGFFRPGWGLFPPAARLH